MHMKPPHSRNKSDLNITAVDMGGRSVRLYQVWKGSNKFFLGGRLIFGPDARSVLLTISLILVPATLFAIFISKDLARTLGSLEGDIIAFIAVVFAIYDIILLLLTSARDPGIVPRNAHPPEPEETVSSNFSSEWPRNQSSASILPLTKDVFVNGIVVKVKYCNTCMLYRPPRCSHCSICNNCVERFDHHCPWVGQCIGRRNYRFFFMFISSTTILCLYVFSFCWINLKKIMEVDDCNFWKSLAISPVSAVLIAFTFMAAWFVGGLTAFHSYLVLTNQTTYENFRYRYDRKLNPYNRGCFKNLEEIIFSEVPRSMNNFRAMVKVESVAFSPQPHGRVRSPDAAKKSFDIEVGGKRFVVPSDEFESMQSQIESTGDSEKLRAKAGNFSWNSSKGNWEISRDIESSEFGMQSGMQSTYTESKESRTNFDIS